MSADTKNFYITTPIYYVNDAPHIGHAYTGIACDVLARFKRLDGYDVRFLTGTDEHGQKVEQSAAKKGVPTQQFTDEVAQHFRDLAELLKLSNDDFIRTTEERHKRSAQAFWKKLEENGQIYLGSYSGWYSVRDEAYYAESELVDGKAPTGAEVEWVEEPSYFFKLSEWDNKLLAWYEQTGAVMPQERLNEVKSFVESGLRDLSVSRTTFRWGVTVPGDEKHVMYVWIDALVNYITALGYPDTDTELFKNFWPNTTHVVGKDILRFHAVYWPAFLMAAGMELPKQVVAHGWWTVEGEKMSKSLGNVVVPAEMVEKYGLDAFRYYLMREKPLASDGNFAESGLVERFNGELGNKVGNLAQRSLSMIAKHCDGKVPSNAAKEACDEDVFLGGGTEEKTSRKYLVQYMRYEESLNQYTPNTYLKEIMAFADRANEYIDREAPWKLRKENPERMEAVLYTVAESVRLLALALLPVVPDSANKLLDQLGVSEDARTFAHFTPEHALKSGTPLPAPSPVFPRLELAGKDAA